MAYRERFVLVFWLEDPRSADVVPKESVVQDAKFPVLLAGQQRQVLWGDDQFPARVIATGKKGDLLKIRVSRDGERVTEVGPTTQCVTTRAKAVAVVEARASRIQAGTLDDLDQLVLIPAAAGPRAQQAAPQPPERLDEIMNLLTNLPCRSEPSDAEKKFYAQLGPKVWVKRDDLIVPLKVHKRQPSKMFMAVLKTLLSDEVLKSGCVSYSGRKGKTAKIPSDIITAALGYTTLNSKGKEFSVTKVVQNLLMRSKLQ